MIKRILSSIMIMVCIALFSTSSFAAYSTQDLTGTWFTHHVVTGDSPADDPRWGYGTVVIDNSANYSASVTSPTQTNQLSNGTIQINISGIITLNNSSQTRGYMNDDKDLIVFIDGSIQSSGNLLGIMVKRDGGVNFNTSDLSGSWYGHHVVSGDAPADDPRWGYGTAVITNSGGYTATWSSPTQTNEVSSGVIQMNGNGIITINNQILTHGVMNDAKDLIVFIDGTNQSSGNMLSIMVKRDGSAAFNTSNLSGAWYGCHAVSGDAPADDPRWGYGSVVLNIYGDYTALWNSVTQTNEISSGSIQIDGSGIFTIDNQSLTHGVMSDDKNILIFVDGSAPSKGSALTILFKHTPPVQSGGNLLLLQ